MFISDIFGGHCSKQDPEVDACLLKSFNNLIEHLKEGDPELGIEQVPDTNIIYVHGTQ